MEKLILLFEEYILKAITLTESVINSDLSDGDKIEAFTANRDRLFSIIDQISKQINWLEVAEEKKEHLNQQINYIKKLDEKLLVKLQEYQMELKKDIEKTYRQKENLKGYNLTDVK
jgi:predicted transcriptional regulator